MAKNLDYGRGGTSAGETTGVRKACQLAFCYSWALQTSLCQCWALYLLTFDFHKHTEASKNSPPEILVKWYPENLSDGGDLWLLEELDLNPKSPHFQMQVTVVGIEIR